MKQLSRTEVKALAASIRTVRQKLGMSQRQFARAVGATQQTVSEWEHGLRLRPIVIAWRLADLLARTK